MTSLLSNALKLRIGGVDAKMALVCLAAHASAKSALVGEVNAEDIEAAFAASELTRQQFKGALKILRDRQFVAVTTKKDLAGSACLVGITIDLNGRGADDKAIEVVGEETPSQRMWRETLAYFRETGKPEDKARGLVGKLLRSAKGDPFAVMAAVRSARRAEAFDPFTWMTKHLTSTGASNGSGIGAALDRAAERAGGVGQDR